LTLDPKEMLNEMGYWTFYI